jgi:hypothetical protein
MLLPSTLQGRPFSAVQLSEIEYLLEKSPESSRYQLSRRLATLWNWRTASGQLKDMAARTLLLKLQEQGWIKLPERRRESPTRSGRAPSKTPLVLLDETRFEGSLSSLLPLRIDELSQLGRHVRRAKIEASVARYHYLGYRSRVGQNLQYWISSAQGRPLACVIFGAAAWQCGARDQWIGWSQEERAHRLSGVVNNTRFLIFDWIGVPHLASHILGSIGQRIAADWKTKYRQALFVLETFVDRERFAGGCYRAAHWLCVGQTRGRGRQGPHDPSTTIKDVYVYPLDPHFRQHLNHSDPPPC